jgi:predicted metal-dependent hydrolase
MSYFKLGDIQVEVNRKDIKNIHLSVHPPKGRVTVSAPDNLTLEMIRVFTISKLQWIKKQQQKFRKQERQSVRRFVNRETHFYLGERYLLQVVEKNAPSKIKLEHKYLVLSVRPGANTEQKRDVLETWYRKRLRETALEIIARWEKILNVKLDDFGIRKMKTRWGSCKIESKRIWLNLELAKKPYHCIEYIIAHEMVHLLERHHNEKFKAHLNTHLPSWRIIRDELNAYPL